jgi:hypothetical protein
MGTPNIEAPRYISQTLKDLRTWPVMHTSREHVALL